MQDEGLHLYKLLWVWEFQLFLQNRGKNVKAFIFGQECDHLYTSEVPSDKLIWHADKEHTKGTFENKNVEKKLLS